MMHQLSLNICHEIIKKINNNTLQLASLPNIIIKVNNALADDRKGIHDIAKVIQNEISLSTRIIHIANSPALRGNKEIISMADAINRLGIALVKNLAICVSLKDQFNTKNVMHKHLVEEITTYSQKASTYGFIICKYLTPHLLPELAIISGLVSKLGHIVILRYMNDTEPYKQSSEEQVSLVLTEVGDEISDIMLRRWEFPSLVINAVFGRLVTNKNDPQTYTDIYALTRDYIAYEASPETVPFIEKFDEIKQLLEDHAEELTSLELVIT